MTILIIPSFECNFRCKYCYLNNTTKGLSYKLNSDFICSVLLQLKDVIRAKQERVKLIWHGGEPLLWGIENYKKVFGFIKQNLSDIVVRNSIQSNLSLIDENYITLFKQYDIKLGFSLDGTKEINDEQRVFTNGKGTFDFVMDKVSLCRSNGINIGCISVCSRKCIGKITQFYHFMNELRLDFKLNPIFETGEALGVRDEFGITAKEYADIMIELFDMCMDDPTCSIEEDNLLEMASAIATGSTTHCVFGYNCQDYFLAIAPTGDVMPCGRFCDNDLLHYSYGNLHRETLAEILPRIKQTGTYTRAEYSATSDCTK